VAKVNKKIFVFFESTEQVQQLVIARAICGMHLR
jgi:hypothetical protein